MNQPYDPSSDEVTIDEPSFEMIKRSNVREILSAVFMGIIVVVFPTLGFLGAKEIDITGGKEEVLGAQTVVSSPTVPVAQANQSFTIPGINQKIDLDVIYKNPQLLYGIGGALAVLAILISTALIKNSLQNRTSGNKSNSPITSANTNTVPKKATPLTPSPTPTTATNVIPTNPTNPGPPTEATFQTKK